MTDPGLATSLRPRQRRAGDTRLLASCLVLACIALIEPAAADERPSLQERLESLQKERLKFIQARWATWINGSKDSTAGAWVKIILKDSAINAQSPVWVPRALLLATAESPEATESIPLIVLDPRPTEIRTDGKTVLSFENNKLSPYYLTNIPRGLLLALQPPKPKLDEIPPRPMAKCTSTISCHGGGTTWRDDYQPSDFPRSRLSEFTFKPLDKEEAGRKALLAFIGRQDALSGISFSRQDLEVPNQFPLEASDYQTDWLLSSHPSLHPMDRLLGRPSLQMEVKAPKELDKPLERLTLKLAPDGTPPQKKPPNVAAPGEITFD